MGHPVTLIQDSSGLGREIAAATRLVIDATGISIDWHKINVNLSSEDPDQASILKQILASIRQTKTAILGPLASAHSSESRPIRLDLYKQLGLYADLRTIQSLSGINAPFQDLDLVIIRGLTEDLSAGIEFERTTREAAEARDFLSRLSGTPIRDDSSIGIKSISVLGSQQIVEFAFRHATVTGRKKITAIHNADCFQQTDGLFLEIAREVAKDYPSIEFEDCLLSNLCIRLMQAPNQYDVLVLPNLYGNVISALCSGMIGGLDFVPRVNVGRDVVVFEAAGTVSPNTGQTANPAALMLSGVLMLQHLHEVEAATKLQKAVETVMSKPKNIANDGDSAEVTSESPYEMAQAIAFFMNQ